MKQKKLSAAHVLLHTLLISLLAQSKGAYAHPFSSLFPWGQHPITSSSSSSSGPQAAVTLTASISSVGAAAEQAAAHATSSKHPPASAAHATGDHAAHGRQLLQSPAAHGPVNPKAAAAAAPAPAAATMKASHTTAAAGSPPQKPATAGAQSAPAVKAPNKPAAAKPKAAKAATPEHAAAAPLAAKAAATSRTAAAAVDTAAVPVAAARKAKAAANKQQLKTPPGAPAAAKAAAAPSTSKTTPAPPTAAAAATAHKLKADGTKQQPQEQAPATHKMNHRQLKQDAPSDVHMTQAEPEVPDPSEPPTVAVAAAAAAATAHSSTSAAPVAASPAVAAAAANTAAVSIAATPPPAAAAAAAASVSITSANASSVSSDSSSGIGTARFNHNFVQSPYGFHQQQQVIKPAWCSKAEGKVSKVSCWMDQTGVITGIQLTDDVGLHHPGMCRTQGAPTAGGYLEEHESIVEIRACKEHSLQSSQGYNYIEFWTDGGRPRPITCGHPPQKMKCEVINSGKVPSWHKSEHTQKGYKWYKEPIYSYDDYKINARSYAKVAAYEIDESDGAASVSIAAVAPQGAYYNHVFPLSELKGSCGSTGSLSRLESACWNKAYKPKAKEMDLGVKLTMDDFYSCPKKPDDIFPLVCYVRDSVQELLYKHGIEAKVKVAPVECKSDVFMNTTINFVVHLRAKHWHKHKGSFPDKIMKCLDDGQDLCEQYAECLACEDHGVFMWEIEKLYSIPKGVKWVQHVCPDKEFPPLNYSPAEYGYNNPSPTPGIEYDSAADLYPPKYFAEDGIQNPSHQTPAPYSKQEPYSGGSSGGFSKPEPEPYGGSIGGYGDGSSSSSSGGPYSRSGGYSSQPYSGGSSGGFVREPYSGYDGGKQQDPFKQFIGGKPKPEPHSGYGDQVLESDYVVEAPALSLPSLEGYEGTSGSIDGSSSSSSSSIRQPVPYVPLPATQDITESNQPDTLSGNVESGNDGFFSDVQMSDDDLLELGSQQQQQQQQPREHPDLEWDTPLPAIPSPRPQVRPAPQPVIKPMQPPQTQPRIRTAPPKQSPTQQVLLKQQQQLLHHNDLMSSEDDSDLLPQPAIQHQQRQAPLTSNTWLQPGIVLPAPMLQPGDLDLQQKLQQTLQQVKKQHQVLELQQQLLQQQLELNQKQKELEELQKQQRQGVSLQQPMLLGQQPVVQDRKQQLPILEQRQQVQQQQRQQLQQQQQHQQHKPLDPLELLLPKHQQQKNQQQQPVQQQETNRLQAPVTKATQQQKQQQQQQRVHKQIGTVRVAPPAPAHPHGSQKAATAVPVANSPPAKKSVSTHATTNGVAAKQKQQPKQQQQQQQGTGSWLLSNLGHVADSIRKVVPHSDST